VHNHLRLKEEENEKRVQLIYHQRIDAYQRRAECDWQLCPCYRETSSWNGILRHVLGTQNYKVGRRILINVCYQCYDTQRPRLLSDTLRILQDSFPEVLSKRDQQDNKTRFSSGTFHHGKFRYSHIVHKVVDAESATILGHGDRITLTFAGSNQWKICSEYQDIVHALKRLVEGIATVNTEQMGVSSKVIVPPSAYFHPVLKMLMMLRS